MKLHVGNLPKDLSNEQLNEIARAFGALESAEIVKDRSSGESRGYGFLVFGNDDEARAAITGLDGKDVHGQAIRVSEARSPKDREQPRA
jgi:RNA recognition motif-containing protein